MRLHAFKSLDDLTGRGDKIALAREAGVNPVVISQAVAKTRGLSLESARKVAPLLDGDVSPAALYLRSQLASIKTRLEAPATKANEHVPSSVLRSIAQIVQVLDNVPATEIAGDEDARASLAEIREIADRLIQYGATVEEPTDASGSIAKKERDAFGRAPKEPETEVRGRDMYGRRM